MARPGQLIAQFEQERDSLRQQVQQLATDKAALEQACQDAQETFGSGACRHDGREFLARALGSAVGRGLT
ncbi:methyltransferase type 11 [Alicycliphilus sp. B1]|nr:methyltransferase type 11 [Alicycliphilus sp. B1]